jgi:hypothetical protein
MSKRGIFAIFLATMFAFSTQSVTAEPIDQKIYSVAAVTSDAAKYDNATQICNKSSVTGEYQQTEKADGSFDVASINCGIAPIPPIGCRVGSCLCDQNGRNCRWTFVCN